MDENIPENAVPIHINKFRSPASVWATEVARDGMSEERLQLHILENRLSKEIMKNRRKDTLPTREPDDMVAVQSLHDSRLWHRGRIEHRMELQTGVRYRVFLVDQGITLRVKPDQMRSLPFKVEDVPYQAMILILEGIVPASLEYSPVLDNFNSEISTGWTNTADKFVENIKSSYAKAYFVEKEGSPGQVRYGDILIQMTDNDRPTSLAELLCQNNYAKYNQAEFKKRQRIENIADAPVICESPLSYGNTTDTTDSCPSPAKSMMSSPNSKVPRPTLSEYMAKIRTQSPKSAVVEKASVSQPSPQSNTAAEPAAMSPQVQGRLALFARLKKGNSSIDTSTSAPASAPSPPSGPLCEGSSVPAAPVKKPSSVVDSSSPKKLDARFIPAGRAIKNEAKPSKSFSFVKSSDSEDSFRSSSKNSIQSWSESSEKPVQNGQGPMARNKLVYNSDSSMSDNSMHRRDPVLNGSGLVADSSKSISDQTGCDSNDSAPQHSNNSSLSKLPGRMSVLAKLRKQEILPSTTDESSGSEGKVGRFTRAFPPTSDSSASQINQDSPGLMKNRLLNCRNPQMAAIEDHASSETYLARPVLLHGGLTPKPWVNYNDLKLKFTSTIEKYLMERRWCYTILTIEKYMWPAIQQRQNVVMISPKKSGKTSSYVIPIMDFMCSQEEVPMGCGPLALILCSGSQSATKIYEECVKSVRSLKKPPQVQVATGLALDNQFIFKLINGCQVYITTPPCLLRILEKYSYAMNLHRLQHFILDEADLIMTRFLKEVKEIQSKVVAEQAIRTKEDKDSKIQIVVSSEKWQPVLLSFSEHLRGSPLLCINDNFESCVYGKPEVVFHLTQSSQKPSKLIQILRDLIGLEKVVVFCNATEIAKVEEFVENSCMNCLVVRPNIDSVSLEAILSSWNSSKAGGHYILVCPDSEFDGLGITDATSVVHYSFPIEDRSSFVKRLSVILSNIPNKLEEKSVKLSVEKSHHLLPSIHLLLDESNSEQLPVIVQLMQRIAGRMDQKFLDIAKNISMNREKKNKMSKLLCTNIKMFGECWSVTECSYRHAFVPEMDESAVLPKSGVVSMQIIHVHSAGHYSVRLVEHIGLDKTVKKWPSEYVKIGMKMALHFKKADSRICVAEINVGDVFAVESDAGIFQRVQILEVLDKDKYGKPVSMLVQYLDEGHHDKIKEYMLHVLPDELKAFPAQVVDLFLCGLLPGDQDSHYGADANSSVKKWTGLKSQSDDDIKQRLVQGQIMLTMTDSLWVDPVNILEWLPLTHEYVVRRNIKQSLLQAQFALQNPDHLPKLFSLCGKDPESISAIIASVKPTMKHKEQCKPSWAFLEADVFEEVEFISAESVSEFFVRRVKFQPLLDDLIKDINLKEIPRKSAEVSLLTPGSICLAKYEDKWHRVRIQSQNDDNSLTVFYVDFGDSENVTLEEIKCIPEWAITQLPFQAIECSLAGVSSCDSVDKLYDMADGHSLLAKVCKRKDAVLTNGSHYVVVLVDCSKPNPSILNKDLLESQGVELCKEEMEYLDFEIDENLLNRCRSVARTEAASPVSQYDTLDEDPDLNLSDLEFKDGDLDDFVDEDTDNGLGDFEICNIDLLAESFKKENEAAVEALAKQMKVSTVAQAPQSQPQPPPQLNSAPDNHLRHSNAESLQAIEKQGDSKKTDDDDSDWENEQEYIGRSVLPVLCSARPPSTKWLEDLYYVWIKICLTGVEKYFLQWTCDSIQFSTCVNGQNYHIDQQLRGAIVPNCVTSSAKGFSVEIKMKKAYSGMFWERLFFPPRKFPWLMRDLEAIDLNSSDSEGEDTLKNLNREIRKVPIKLRRRPLDKFEKHQERKPDLESDSPDSNAEAEMVDSDEFF